MLYAIRCKRVKGNAFIFYVCPDLTVCGGCKILSVKSEHLLAIRALSFFLDFALSQCGMAAARRRAAAMPGKKKLEVFSH